MRIRVVAALRIYIYIYSAYGRPWRRYSAGEMHDVMEFFFLKKLLQYRLRRGRGAPSAIYI